MDSMKDGDGNTNTVWVASPVPVPVKIVGEYGGQSTTMELTGWG